MFSKRKQIKALILVTSLLTITIITSVFFNQNNLASIKNYQFKTDSLSRLLEIDRNKIDSIDFLLNSYRKTAPLTGVIKHYINIAPAPVVMYETFNLKPAIVHQRPLVSKDIFLCIPAAYTNLKNDKIKGLFIENGEVINDELLNGFKGACIISNDNIEILRLQDINDSIIAETERYGHSLFQQSLLVYDFKVIPYGNFKDFRTKRRAIAIKDNKFYVCESAGPVYFKEFQKALANTGVEVALYTDMGSWSEGWYRNYQGRIIRIGDNFLSTRRQSNWLILKSEKH